MNNKLHNLLNPGSYVLSQDQYEDLCTVRDKLLLMAQLAGPVTAMGDNNTMLFIRRALLGRLFGDLSFQICDVLDDIAHDTAQLDRVHEH